MASRSAQPQVVARRSSDAVTDAGSARAPVTNDRPLVDRIRLGDAAAFEALVRAFVMPLTSFAEGYTGSRDAARDIVQDVLSRVWVKREAWRPTTTVAAYLYGAVRNAALNALKHDRVEARFQRAARTAVPGEPSVDPIELPDERLVAVRCALLGLTERQRSAIRLRYAQSLTMPEVAAALGVRLGVAEKLVARALAALRSAVRSPP